jgi:hypothetical protein
VITIPVHPSVPNKGKDKYKMAAVPKVGMAKYSSWGFSDEAPMDTAITRMRDMTFATENIAMGGEGINGFNEGVYPGQQEASLFVIQNSSACIADGKSRKTGLKGQRRNESKERNASAKIRPFKALEKKPVAAGKSRMRLNSIASLSKSGHQPDTSLMVSSSYKLKQLTKGVEIVIGSVNDDMVPWENQGWNSPGGSPPRSHDDDDTFSSECNDKDPGVILDLEMHSDDPHKAVDVVV